MLHGMNLALFDFDGTITTREMFPDFMRFAVSRRRLVVGSALFAPMVVGYKMGIVSGSTIRQHLVNFGFRGVASGHFETLGKRFSDKVLPDVLRPEALARIRWHQSQGDRVVVVSGALDVYLSHWCRRHHVDLLCSSLEVENGRLTGRFRGAQCVGAEKSRRVRERCKLDDFSMVYAYGDTKEDLDMLNIAHKKYYRWQEVA
jgi:phosphatidylglycerophosphatase C